MLHFTLSQLDARNILQEEDGSATMKVFESTSRSEGTPCGQVFDRPHFIALCQHWL
jgi:hypothetical protein